MDTIYFKLILAERRKFEDVPENLKPKVKELLDKYNENSAK